MKRALEIVRGHPLLLVVAAIAVAYAVLGDRLPSLDLEKALDDLAATLGNWTYLVVSLLAFLETGAFVGLVFPGETAVIVAGAIAGQGETSIVITIALVWVSAWLGDSASFYIGSRLGRSFILKHGQRVRITPERFAQVEAYFENHGGKTILIGRFLGLVRALAPFIAGSSGMKYRDFLPYSVLGTGLWSAAFSLLGYFLAENIHLAENIAGRGIFIFGAIVVLVVGAIVAVHHLRDPKGREKIAGWLEARGATRPLVLAGRRVKPQATFVWHRVTPGNLGLEFTTLMAILAVALFIVAGYGAMISDAPGPTTGDQGALDLADGLRSGALTEVAKVVTAFGGTAAILATALLAAIALGSGKRWPEFWVLLCALAICLIAVPALKELLDRPRPPSPLVDAGGAAWPSGHATYAVLYPFLALVATLRIRPGKAYGTALLVGATLLASGIALSRVYLRVHYLSDVNAGGALGVAAFATCAAVALVVVHIRDNGTRA